jgi:FixJ family two-component response regulator
MPLYAEENRAMAGAAIRFWLAANIFQRVIVTSTHAENDLRSEVLRMGGYDVLAKPFDENETLRLVDEARQEWQKARSPIYQMARALRMTA